MTSKDDPDARKPVDARSPSREEALARLETMIDPPESQAKPRKPLQPALARDRDRGPPPPEPDDAPAPARSRSRTSDRGEPGIMWSSLAVLLGVIILPTLLFGSAIRLGWLTPKPVTPAQSEFGRAAIEAAPHVDAGPDGDALAAALADLQTAQDRIADDVARLSVEIAALRAPQPATTPREANADLDALNEEIDALRVALASLETALRDDVDAPPPARPDQGAALAPPPAADPAAIEVLRARVDRLEARQRYLNEHVLAGAIRNAPARPVPGG